MSNTNMDISSLSTEPVYVSFRIEHPITGPEDLSGATVDIALVLDKPVGADWISGTVQPGTWEAPDGEAYYIASGTVDGSTLSLGTVQVWVKVQHNGHTYVSRTGSALVY